MNPIQANRLNGITYGQFSTTIDRFAKEREDFYFISNVAVAVTTATIVGIANFIFSITILVNLPRVDNILTSGRVTRVIANPPDILYPLLNLIFGTFSYPIFVGFGAYGLGSVLIESKIKNFKQFEFAHQYQSENLLQGRDILKVMPKLSTKEQKIFIENMSFEQLYYVRHSVSRNHFESLIKECRKEDHVSWKNILRLTPNKKTEAFDLSQYVHEDPLFYTALKEEARNSRYVVFQHKNTFLSSIPGVEHFLPNDVIMVGNREVKVNIQLLRKHGGKSFYSFNPDVASRLSAEEQDRLVKFFEACGSSEKEITPEIAARIFPLAMQYQCTSFAKWLKQIIVEHCQDVTAICANQTIKDYPLEFREVVEKKIIGIPLSLENCIGVHEIATAMQSAALLNKCQLFVESQIDVPSARPVWLPAAEAVLGKAEVETKIYRMMELKHLRALYDFSVRFDYKELNARCIRFCSTLAQGVRDAAIWKVNEIIPKEIATILYPSTMLKQPW